MMSHDDVIVCRYMKEMWLPYIDPYQASAEYVKQVTNGSPFFWKERKRKFLRSSSGCGRSSVGRAGGETSSRSAEALY